MSNFADALAADVARLRRALQAIVDYQVPVQPQPIGAIVEIKRIAREALEGK